MRVPIAFISVILIWSTTPLAIKWSTQGPGFLFGVTARMAIGTWCVLLIMLITGKRLPGHSKALQTYVAVALQIYGAMMAVYWAAQFIPSGWISVIFGLTPCLTAVLAAICLGERSLTLSKLLAYALGVAGLAIMFNSALHFGTQAAWGVLSVLLATFLQSASAVWVKRIHAGLPAMSQVAGGLLFALPGYLLTWHTLDGRWPISLPYTSLAAILYLGLIATPVGFALYYYVLIHLQATRVALITLVSPVIALMLGYFLNNEPLTMRVATGSVLILSALFIHQFYDRYKEKGGP